MCALSGGSSDKRDRRSVGSSVADLDSFSSQENGVFLKSTLHPDTIIQTLL
jgi:hypothetical protein